MTDPMIEAAARGDERAFLAAWKQALTDAMMCAIEAGEYRK